jgi:hypothetical protein
METFPPPTPVEAQVVPRSKRRNPLLFAAAAAALVVIAAVVLTRGGGGTTYALSSVGDTAAEAKAVQYEMTVDVAGKTVPVSTTLDLHSRLATMTMDMSVIGPGASKGEILMDTKNLVMYLPTSMFAGVSGFPKIDATYLKMDLKALAARVGAAGALDLPAPENPLDAADLFAESKVVTEVGDETIDGETLRHYQVVVDTQAIIAKSPQVKKLLDASGQPLPDTLTYDVWVTKGNEMRRMKVDVPIPIGPVSVDVTLHALDHAAPIELPPASETKDVGELLGAGR